MATDYRYPKDIYTEPDFDPVTLNQLGPLRRMAGIWQGTRGLDTKPKAEGPKKQVYVEHYELQPIDAQTNGPQLYYGLRYHVHITKPNQAKTYHDQIGYWLWEPATHTVVHTLALPRGQTALLGGVVDPDANAFELTATHGSTVWGICSNPFLEQAFKTLEVRVRVFFNADGTWGYDEDTVLQIPGLTEPFHHTDRNILHKVAEPTPNPLALAATGQPVSDAIGNPVQPPPAT